MLTKNWPVLRLFDLWVDSLNKLQLTKVLIEVIKDRQTDIHVVTMNAEMAFETLNNIKLKQVIQSADIVIPDGIGVVWAINRMGFSIDRLPGIELVQALLNVKHVKIYLLGSSQDTLQSLLNKLPHDYQHAEIVGSHHGFFKPEEEMDIIDEINQSRADILLVALGVPRQEFWIYKNRHHIKVPVKIGVGGSFDVLAGKLQRAPDWMQKHHVEWLYRLIQEPTRWKRMLALPQFVFRVIRAK